jgi:uncharacterized protein YdcH (DUF465 family)
VSEAAVAAALAEKQRADLVKALKAEDAMYERLHEQYGSFAEAAYAWLEENSEEA